MVNARRGRSVCDVLQPLIRVLTVALVVASCDSPTAPPATNAAPDELRITTFAQSHGALAELVGDTLVIVVVIFGAPVLTDTARVVPTPEQWRDFWTAVRASGFRRWLSEYESPDGIFHFGWSATIAGGGFSKASKGWDSTPDGFGLRRGYRTAAWHTIMDAVNELSGGAFQPTSEPHPK